MTRFLLLAAASLLAQPAVAAESKAVDPVPLGNPGSWVGPDDYPDEAMANDLEGIVAFRLDIDTSGRVSNCTVTQSSGTDILDVAACNLISRRAVFSPARDASGAAVAGVYTNRVRWSLPNEMPQPVERDVIFSWVVDEQGISQDCRFERRDGVPEDEAMRHLRVCGRVVTQPYRDASGKEMRVRVRQRLTVTIEPVE